MNRIMTFHRVYQSIRHLTKATCTLEAKEVGYGELAFVDGRPAQVIRLEGSLVTLQVFSGTEGLSTDSGVRMILFFITASITSLHELADQQKNLHVP